MNENYNEHSFKKSPNKWLKKEMSNIRRVALDRVKADGISKGVIKLGKKKKLI